ncbi:MAG: PilZ domain-containing protein [Syntrophobacteraceae bacterium]
MQKKEYAEREEEAFAREHTSVVSRIPLQIEDEIIVRSLANAAHKTRSKIIGAVHGKFILIEEPVVMINDRLSASMEEEGFLCSYFTEGTLYNFKSKYRGHLSDDIASIDYPREIEVRQVRKYRRIRVNIETEFQLEGTSDSFLGDMHDISQGGCRLSVHSLLPATKGMGVTLMFSLPNEEAVSGLQGTIMGIRHLKSHETTELGLCFNGNEDELAKVADFCEFCMFFEVE